MNNSQPNIILRPIGFVRNGIQEFKGHDWKDVISEIVIQPELNDALDNLDEFSHIIIIFWTQGVIKKATPNKIRMQHNPGKPLVGLFATRSPDRPNSICMTTVNLLERRENVLKVKGLDAFDSTVIIDIKPFIPGYDSAEEAKVPGWIRIR
jgi:tRNA (adenine37-N6)-methyltransferase